MFLLHAVLLLSVLLPALSAPELSRARARVNEIRSRVQENRSKLKTNAAKITNQFQPARPKRQYYPEYAPPLPPVQPVEYQNAEYDDQHPTLVHICSVEDDGYARSAEEHQNSQMQPEPPKSRKRKPPALQTGGGRGAANFLEDDRLNPRDLQEMADVREIMSRFGDEALRNSESLEQRPNSKYLGNNFGQNSTGDSRNSTQTQTSPRGNEDLLQTMQVDNEEQLPETREAEGAANPHLHSHFHNHGTYPVSTPGLHYAHESLYRPVLAPGLNLNFNQHQSIQPLIHSNLLNTHSVASITQPIQNTVVSAETQPVFFSRFSQKDAEADFPRFYDPHTGMYNSTQQHIHSTSLDPEFFPSVTQTTQNKEVPAETKPVSTSRFSQKVASADFPPSFVLGDPPFGLDSVDHEIPHERINKHRHHKLAKIDHSHHLRDAEDSRGQNFEEITWVPFGDSEDRILTQEPEFSSGENQHQTDVQPSSADDLDNNLTPKIIRPLEPHRRPGSESNSHQFETNRPSAIDRSEEHNNFRPIGTTDLRETEEHEADLLPFERVASPKFKNKKLKKIRVIPIYLDRYPTYGSYYDNGYYREAEIEPDLQSRDDESSEELEIDDDIIVDEGSSESRKAKTKQRRKQKQKLKQQQNQRPKNWDRPKFAEEGDFFQNREVEENADIFDSREPEASRRKKDKHEWPPKVGAQQQEENEDFFYNRGAEEENEDFSHNRGAEEDTELFGSRETGATPKKQHKHKFPQRSGEEFEGRQEFDKALDELISSNYLFRFPERRRYTNEFKRSLAPQLDELLGKHRQVVDSLQRHAQDDDDLKFVADLSNRTLADMEEKAKKITKRSIPLTRLISDPNVRLDVPQTIENFGTATKNAVEDERAPIYHLKQMIGSSKNALLSALRIPPQNMIIPSDYEIVKASEFDPGTVTEEEDSNDPFSQTFQKVGQMVRQSVKSSQEAVAHLGEAAHSARNVINTARHAAPRLIVPYSQIPAIQNPKKRIPNKAILITPRIVDLAEEPSHLGRTAESKPNFVRFGHLTDALGISKPHSRNLDLQKIIFEPRRFSAPKVGSKLAEMYGRFRNNHDGVDTTLNTLEDAKVSVGAQNLKDLLVKMKHELSDVVRNTPHKRSRIGTKRQQEGKEMGAFIETLFDGNDQPKNDRVLEDTKRERKKENEEVVGAGLLLPPELLHPFMGRPSQDELKNFLSDNGDEGVNVDLEHPKKQPVPTTDDGLHQLNHSDLGSVLGAINPLMMERLFNNSVRVSNNDAPNLEGMLQRHHESDANDTVGGGLTSFGLTGPLQRPFMDQARPQQIEDFLDTYNQEEPDYIDSDE